MDGEKKFRDAVAVLEDVGFQWRGGAWVIHHTEDLPADRRLSLVDVGDKLYERLNVADGDAPEAMLARMWEQQTDYIGRHLSRTPPPGPPKVLRPMLRVVPPKE